MSIEAVRSYKTVTAPAGMSPILAGAGRAIDDKAGASNRNIDIRPATAAPWEEIRRWMQSAQLARQRKSANSAESANEGHRVMGQVWLAEANCTRPGCRLRALRHRERGRQRRGSRRAAP